MSGPDFLNIVSQKQRLPHTKSRLHIPDPLKLVIGEFLGENAMRRSVSVVLSCVLIVALSACQTTSLATRDFLWDGDSKRRVVLMPVDIELSLLNAGGVNEPNAAWTKTGAELAIAALREKMSESSAQLVTSDLNKTKADPDSIEVQLVKLHGEVGSAILAHKYVPILALPTKAETFDWTLGEEAKALAKKIQR